MSLHHSFDIQIAKKYGVNVAIFLNNLAHWTHINISNQNNFYDGTYWSYNTQEALLSIFSYWSRQTLRTTIDRCDKERLIVKGNYNKSTMDRTAWYAFTEEGMSLFPALESLKNTIGGNQPLERLESTNTVVGINQAIPDTNTDSKAVKIKSSCDQPPEKPKADQKKKQKPSGKTIKSNREANAQKHHWAANAKVCEPVTEDPVICGGCKRPDSYCSCGKEYQTPPRLEASLVKAFAAQALEKLGKAKSHH